MLQCFQVGYGLLHRLGLGTVGRLCQVHSILCHSFLITILHLKNFCSQLVYVCNLFVMRQGINSLRIGERIGVFLVSVFGAGK